MPYAIVYVESAIKPQISRSASERNDAIEHPFRWLSSVETQVVKYHFYRAMLCIRGTSHGPVSVCVCVCHKSEFY